MRRFRETLITATAVVALAAMAGETLAQQQGGGGGGGGGGRGARGGFGGGPGGPGGFFGGRGGFGGPGGNLLGMALNPAVQSELQVTDPQKIKLQDLNEKLNQSRQKIMEQFRPQGQQGGRGNRNNGQNGGGQNGGGQNGGGNGQGGFGGQNGGGNGQGGFGGQNGGGRGGRGQQDPEAMARRQAMFESMNEIQQLSDQTLAKILSRGQMGRLKQIQLQAEGPRALTRPDMVERLNLDEEQVAQIQQLLGEERQAMFGTFQARRDLMNQAFPQGNNTNNGGQGGVNGGGGRPRGPNFRDPAVREAMQKYMEQPEVKAKLDQIQTQTDKLQSQLKSAVNRVLTRRQAATYQKMLGAPFDINNLRGGPGGRGPGGNRNQNANGNAPNGGAQPAAKTANNDDDEEAAPAAKPAAKAPTQTPAKARRKSLRAQRGLDD